MPITIPALIAMASGAIDLIVKIFGLISQLHAGTIKPEDINPDDLVLPTWDDVVKQAQAKGQLPG